MRVERVKIKDREYPLIYGIRCMYVSLDESLDGFDKELASLHAALKSGADHEGENFDLNLSDLERLMDEDVSLYSRLSTALVKCIKEKSKNVKSPKKKVKG